MSNNDNNNISPEEKNTPSNNPFEYNIGEEVFAFSGPLLYRAKVLKTRIVVDSKTKEKVPNYFLHYQGWGKRWDDWLRPEFIEAITEDTILHQKELAEKHKSKTPKNIKKKNKNFNTLKSLSKTSEQVITNVNSGKRLKIEEGFLPKNSSLDSDASSKFSLKLSLYFKKFLIEDWKNITRQKQLVPLPRNPNVAQILQQFEEYMTNQNKNLNFQEISAGLIEYFDKSLGIQLLYEKELAQHTAIFKEYPDSLPNQIYGFEHLLRLLVKLPILLFYTDLDNDFQSNLYSYLQELVYFLQKQSSEYQINYIESPLEYDK